MKKEKKKKLPDQQGIPDGISPLLLLKPDGLRVINCKLCGRPTKVSKSKNGKKKKFCFFCPKCRKQTPWVNSMKIAAVDYKEKNFVIPKEEKIVADIAKEINET